MPVDTGLTVQWLGDIALTAQFMDPSSHSLINENVAYLRSTLPPADLKIANWEAPLIGSEGINPHKKIALHTDEQTASHVASLDLDIAIVANNHIFDCMESGFERTVSFLEAREIHWVGAGLTQIQAGLPLFIDMGGIRVAVLAYVDRDTNPQVPADQSMYVNWLEPERVTSQVRDLHEQGYTVLVSFHCGMDFVALPSPLHRAAARRTIEAGASLVVCYHPHRLQAHERWGEGCIFYGLGNLLAGNIYPWPRIAEPAVAITCRLDDRHVIDVDFRHFIFRNGRITPDLRKRGMRLYRRGNRKIAAPDEKYKRHFAKALAYELAFARPWHFIRRNRNPLKMLCSLEKRHVSEYRGLISGMFKGHN